MIKTLMYGPLSVALGRSGASFSFDGKIIGIARRVTGGWALRIPGHIWPVTPDMPTARFNQIPGDKITSTPVKGFKSWRACANECLKLNDPQLVKRRQGR